MAKWWLVALTAAMTLPIVPVIAQESPQTVLAATASPNGIDLTWVVHGDADAVDGFVLSWVVDGETQDPQVLPGDARGWHLDTQEGMLHELTLTPTNDEGTLEPSNPALAARYPWCPPINLIPPQAYPDCLFPLPV